MAREAHPVAMAREWHHAYAWAISFSVAYGVKTRVRKRQGRWQAYLDHGRIPNA